MRAADPESPPVDQIVAMVDGYLDAALDEEIRRITLIDGPAMLGHEPDEPGRRSSRPTWRVRAFIATAIERGQLVDLDPGVLAHLVGGLALRAGC